MLQKDISTLAEKFNKVIEGSNNTMPVEVFKTNVTDGEVASKIVSDLTLHLPESKVNFDLTDCDNILRIESAKDIHIESVTQHMIRWGYFCEVLES